MAGYHRWQELLVKMAVMSTCLPAASPATTCRSTNGGICGTIGQRIVGDTVAKFPADFRKCVEACTKRANCTSVNHWSSTGICQLVNAVDTPGKPHEVKSIPNCFSVLLKPRCAVKTEPSSPMTYRFVLPEQTAPFRVQFAVRVAHSAIIALAEGPEDENIFCHISLGGWSNSKATIRTGDLKNERNGAPLPIHAENNALANQLSGEEYRHFVIEYTVGGLLKVGKGVPWGVDMGVACDVIPFMQWDVGTLDPSEVAPTKVNIAISSWEKLSADWVFEQRCD